jgi:hypothetical protein
MLVLQVGFNFDINQYMPVSVLMYKLQRRNTDQSSEDVISNEEATCI